MGSGAPCCGSGLSGLSSSLPRRWRRVSSQIFLPWPGGIAEFYNVAQNACLVHMILWKNLGIFSSKSYLVALKSSLLLFNYSSSYEHCRFIFRLTALLTQKSKRKNPKTTRRFHYLSVNLQRHFICMLFYFTKDFGSMARILIVVAFGV